MSTTMKETWVDLSVRAKEKCCRYDAEIAELGERIDRLLSSQKVLGSSFAIATLDDLLGSLYAFVLALHNDPSFKFRPVGKRVDIRVIQKRAASVAQAHRIRTSGKWMSGFHFNSGLFRLLSVYHRSLKIVVGRPKCKDFIGKESDPKSLLSEAKRIFNAWTGDNWVNTHVELVREQVNDLKHHTGGIYWGRLVKESEALAAGRELVTLLEVWVTRP